MPDATILAAIGTMVAASAAIFSACAAIRIAKATDIYTAFTQRTWEELRRQNERAEQPNVQVVLGPKSAESTLFQLVVRNQGHVPVYDVAIEVTPANIPGIGRAMLMNYNLFRQPILVMPEGQEISGVLFKFRDALAAMPTGDTLTFTVAYKTADGRSHQQIYQYNLAIYEGLLDPLPGTLPPAAAPTRWADRLPHPGERDAK